MDTLIFLNDLHAVTLIGIDKGVIKSGDTEFPIKIFIKDDEKEWEFVMFSPNGKQLLIKSIFKVENIKDDGIPLEVLTGIKEIIDGWDE